MNGRDEVVWAGSDLAAQALLTRRFQLTGELDGLLRYPESGDVVWRDGAMVQSRPPATGVRKTELQVALAALDDEIRAKCGPAPE